MKIFSSRLIISSLAFFCGNIRQQYWRINGGVQFSLLTGTSGDQCSRKAEKNVTNAHDHEIPPYHPSHRC